MLNGSSLVENVIQFVTYWFYSWTYTRNFNPLTMNDNCSCHQIRLAQSVLKITERWDWRGGWVHRSGRQCMAAVAAGYRKGLVSAGWPVLLLSCTNERRKWSFHLVGAPLLAFSAAFSLEEHSLDGIPDYWMLGNEWVWSGSWTCKELLKEAVDQVSQANSRQRWKYKWKKVGLIYTRPLGKLI